MTLACLPARLLHPHPPAQPSTKQTPRTHTPTHTLFLLFSFAASLSLSTAFDGFFDVIRGALGAS
eukprot:m.232498 g.232498  ORF g.232498 m.232498 type:complete len:65 (-) comp18746_c0_seq1:53-247(-)